MGLICTERALKIVVESLGIHARFAGLSLEVESNWMIAKNVINAVANFLYLLAHWLFSWRYLVVSQTIVQLSSPNKSQPRSLALNILNYAVCAAIFGCSVLYGYIWVVYFVHKKYNLNHHSHPKQLWKPW